MLNSLSKNLVNFSKLICHGLLMAALNIDIYLVYSLNAKVILDNEVMLLFKLESTVDFLQLFLLLNLSIQFNNILLKGVDWWQN